MILLHTKEIILVVPPGLSGITGKLIPTVNLPFCCAKLLAGGGNWFPLLPSKLSPIPWSAAQSWASKQKEPNVPTKCCSRTFTKAISFKLSIIKNDCQGLSWLAAVLQKVCATPAHSQLPVSQDNIIYLDAFARISVIISDLQCYSPPSVYLSRRRQGSLARLLPFSDHLLGQIQIPLQGAWYDFFYLCM